MGRQWFPLALGDLARLLARRRARRAGARTPSSTPSSPASSSPTRDLALVGFSQGTMMALHVGLRRERRRSPASSAIPACSPAPEHLKDANVHKAPILLVHGDADPLIPVMALHAAVQSLGAAGFLTEWHVSPGLAHGIDDDGLAPRRGLPPPGARGLRSRAVGFGDDGGQEEWRRSSATGIPTPGVRSPCRAGRSWGASRRPTAGRACSARNSAPSHTVIAEGLNGRTTVHDDPIDGVHKNGARFLPVVLETHAPIDLLIIKLGTNDLKMRFSVTAYDIADGAGHLVDVARASANKPRQGAAQGAPRRPGAAGAHGLDRGDVRRRDREVEEPRQGDRSASPTTAAFPSSTPARWSRPASSTASISTRRGSGSSAKRSPPWCRGFSPGERYRRVAARSSTTATW